MTKNLQRQKTLTHKSKSGFKWERWKRKSKSIPSVKKFKSIAQANTVKKNLTGSYNGERSMAFANTGLTSADRSCEQDTNNEDAEAQTISAGFPESQEESSKDTSGFISFSDNLHSNEINDGSNDSRLNFLDTVQRRLSHLLPNQGHQSSSVPYHQQLSFQATHAQSGNTTSKPERLCQFVTSDRKTTIRPRRSLSEDQTFSDYLNQSVNSDAEEDVHSLHVFPDTSVSSGFASYSLLSHNGQTDRSNNNAETDESIPQEGLNNYLVTMPESESHIPREAAVKAVTKIDKGMLKQIVTKGPFVQDQRYCSSCPESPMLSTEFKVPKRSRSSDDLDLTNDHHTSGVHDATTEQTSTSLNQELVHRETSQDSELYTQEMISDMYTSLSSGTDLRNLTLQLSEVCPSEEDHTQDLLEHFSEPELDNTDMCCPYNNFTHTGITHSSPCNSFPHTENCPKNSLSAETPFEQTELLWQWTNTSSQQTQASSLQTETPEQIVTPQQQNEAALQKTKTPTQLTKTKIQPTETLIQPQLTETQAPQTKTPTYTEPPAQQIETVRQAETPYQNTNTHPVQTEPSSEETDTSVYLLHSKLEQCMSEHIFGSEHDQQPNHPQINETDLEETVQKMLVGMESTHDTTTTHVSATVTQEEKNALLVSSQQTTAQGVTENELLPEENIQEVSPSSSLESVSSASHQTAAEPGDEGGTVADAEHDMGWMNVDNVQEEQNRDVYAAGTSIQTESDDRLNDISLGDEMQAMAPPLPNLVQRNPPQHILIHVNPPWPVPTDIDINGNSVQNFGQQDLYPRWPVPVNIDPLWPVPVNIDPPWPVPVNIDPPWPISTDIDIHRTGDHNFDQE